MLSCLQANHAVKAGREVAAVAVVVVAAAVEVEADHPMDLAAMDQDMAVQLENHEATEAVDLQADIGLQARHLVVRLEIRTLGLDTRTGHPEVVVPLAIGHALLALLERTLVAIHAHAPGPSRDRVLPTLAHVPHQTEQLLKNIAWSSMPASFA